MHHIYDPIIPSSYIQANFAASKNRFRLNLDRPGRSSSLEEADAVSLKDAFAAFPSSSRLPSQPMARF